MAHHSCKLLLLYCQFACPTFAPISHSVSFALSHFLLIHSSTRHPFISRVDLNFNCATPLSYVAVPLQIQIPNRFAR